MNDENKNLIPEGYYEAVAVETTDDQGVCAYARLALTKGGGKQVAAHFKILNPPEGFSAGFPLPWYGAFTATMVGDSGKSVAQRTCESLRHMGLKGDDLTECESQPLDQIVSVKVEHNEWEGKTRARIAFVNPVGGGTIKLNNPMPEIEKRKFAAMMKGSLGKLPVTAGERVSGGESRSMSKSAGTAHAHAAKAAGGGGGGADRTPETELLEDDIPFATAELCIGKVHQPGGRAI
jgi:hypothetical protein